ncbi:MAG: Gfo/Idh/MocA family oxidoreductase [Pirellulales bacterium]
MKKPTIRAGIVGSGYAAAFHFAALSKVSCANVEVVGVYSPVPAHRESYARERGIHPAESLEALMAQADVVHVCTPPRTHEAITIAGLERDKFVICEKVLTGFFGEDIDGFHGDTFPKQVALDAALASLDRILQSEKRSRGKLLYAENWIYAPSIQREREIIEKTGAQLLWIQAEESHSGSHGKLYGRWTAYGGGALVGMGCHPLTAALYLKRVEGRAHNGRPIQPKSVSARAHALTRNPNFRSEGHIRCDYHDIDDVASVHVEFDDGTVADIRASTIVIGGIRNYLHVAANNHVTFCNINPNSAMLTYNPREESFRDVYTVEKISTKQGWTCISPDEDWFTGYPQEMEAFYRAVALGEQPESNSALAADAVSTLYSAHLSSESHGHAVAVRTY